MSSINVTVFKDSVGFHPAGVTKVLNPPITSLGPARINQYADVDMVGCGSDEAQPGGTYLKVYTPETGIIYINDTESSLHDKLTACCIGEVGGGGPGGSGGSVRFVLESYEVVPGGAGFANLNIAGKTINAIFIGDYSKVVGFNQSGNNITFTDGTTVSAGDTIVAIF